jgi:hypothetical protein
MDKTEQQQEATQFSIDYFRYLLHQEEMIDRIVKKNMDQLEPQIASLIDQKIEQRLKEFINK